MAQRVSSLDDVQTLLDWTIALGFREAATYSLLVNVAVFGLALAFGQAVAHGWQDRRVASPPPPLSRAELGLATACVLLNSGVMLAGWALFRAGFVRVSAAASPLVWALDALVLLVVMDFAMYVTHRLAHHPLAFRFIHGVHHRYDAPRPLTLFVLHPLEVVGFGGLWIVVLCTHAFSLGGMLAYLTLNTTFGALGHVGVEPLPHAFARWRIVGAVGTSTFHARHHQTPTSNFGFYTAIWDRLFGTLDTTYVDRFAKLPTRVENALTRPPRRSAAAPISDDEGA